MAQTSTNFAPLHQISALIRGFEKFSIFNVVEIGRLLRQAKEQCEHGEFQDWLSREFSWSYRTALRYGYANDFAQKCSRVTFEKLNISIGALHVVADPGTSDEEQAAIVRAAQEGRVTASVAKDIVLGLRNPPALPVEPGDDPIKTAEPAGQPEPDDDEEPTPERLQGGLRVHAEGALEFANSFSDQDIAKIVKQSCNGDAKTIIAVVRRLEMTWGALAAKIERAAGLGSEEFSPGRSALQAKADRAEARSRGLAS